jgi:hypothetical protein
VRTDFTSSACILKEANNEDQAMAKMTIDQFLELFPSFRRAKGPLAEEILLGSAYK